MRKQPVAEIGGDGVDPGADRWLDHMLEQFAVALGRGGGTLQVLDQQNGREVRAGRCAGENPGVEGLAPGVTRTLFLKLSNPNNGDISVQSLTVAVGDSSKTCTGANVRVGALTGPVFVPGRGTAQVTLPVTMLGTAPGACQGATFPLTYGGSAVKA